jgi:hypothetical protein
VVERRETGGIFWVMYEKISRKAPCKDCPDRWIDPEKGQDATVLAKSGVYLANKRPNLMKIGQNLY